MAPQMRTEQVEISPKSSFASKTPVFPPRDLQNESDAELELARQQGERAWEGFGDEELRNEDSENDSMDITMEKEEDELEKGESEEELERLVFGDSAGFKAGLKSFPQDLIIGAYGGALEKKEEEEQEYWENKEDQDLFFFDSGPGAAPARALATTGSQDGEEDGDKPAWEDSDDDKIIISLASVPRLRKLRETEQDDVVGGKEYIRRLRRQYHRLHPPPEWAIEAIGNSKTKKQRTLDDGESEDARSDVDVDGEHELSTQPLARLLKDAEILSRKSSNPTKRRRLQPGTIAIQRLRDVAKPGPSAITSLSFHSTYPLLLSSGPSSTLYLHHITPDSSHENPLLTSLHIKRTPLTTTAFHPSPSDSRIFISARRRYFHIWNLATGSIEKISRIYGHQHEQRTMEHFLLSPNGKYMALRGSSKKGGGVVNVLDASTLQWVTQVRIESQGGVADFAWWGDGNGLSIAGKNGETTEWSIRDGIKGRWIDEGAVGTTVIALGGRSGRDGWIGGNRWVAVGSSSGIVNIYDRRAWSENNPAGQRKSTEHLANGVIPQNPKPIRSLDNLTTPISHLTFSPDGQILCMASRWKHNALRLIHLPTCTVFKNWPTQKTPLDRISAVAWGKPLTDDEEKEGSLALLACASEMGRIRLWEIRD